MNDTQQSTVVSEPRILRTLIVKDWRFFRVPMLAMIAVGAASYFIGLVFKCMNYPMSAGQVLETINDSSVAAIALISLLASAMGGIAIAGERSDRSADFIALLPVTRAQIILSKWLTSLFMLGVFFVLFAAIAISTAFVQGFYWPRSQIFYEWRYGIANWAGCTLCFFGVAWLLSTFIRSGPISACVSIGVTLCTIVLVVSVMDGNHHTGSEAAIYLACVNGAIGFICLIGGTVYYLRRIAP